MGPQANVLHSLVRISSWLFLNVGSCLCLSSVQHLSLFHVRAVTCTGQALQTLESRSVRRRCGWCLPSWVKVHLAVWLQETLLTETSWHWYWNQTDAHSSEDEDISAQSDSDTSDITDTNFTQRTDDTSRRPIVPVVHKLTGGPDGLQQRHPRSIKTLPHWAFSCFSVLKFYSCWWHRQIDITSTWTHWTKDSLHCLTWQFRKHVCFCQLLCRWGTIKWACWKITGWY